MRKRSTNVWADPITIGKHTARQILVPSGDDFVLTQDDHGCEYINAMSGQWPVSRGAISDAGPLTAVLPVLGDGVPLLKWRGSRIAQSPEQVLSSYDGAIGFTPHDQPRSLRRPQIAALHSIIGYQSSGLRDPAIVVMPTGTGKTETMLAWFVASRPEKLLVIVPSTHLRDQIGAKFETLGVLQPLGVVDRTALRPSVVRLEHRIANSDEARAVVAAANIVVATPQAIRASEPDVRNALYACFSHLIVDEAHHAPAETWSEVITAFAGRPAVLFTATPFRRDGLTIPGRMVFRFPLSEAQRDGYFSPIDFTAVLDLQDDDQALARAAVERLRSDLAEGFQHVLLARVKTKSRAEAVRELYGTLAPDLSPAVLHDGLSSTRRLETLAALRDGSSRIIVCVDMLGEGFDLPTLKIGAFHDTHRSLSPMIQLIGRLARTQAEVPIGPASVFVRQDPKNALSPLRFLLQEDPDWDRVLSDVTERATALAEEINAFDSSFSDTPLNIPIAMLEPKMSALAYRVTSEHWDPLAALHYFGSALLDERISVNSHNDLAWFVVQAKSRLRWADLPDLEQTSYDLVALHMDRERGLLYLHGSDTKKDYDPLVERVLGTEARRVSNYDTFRVFAGLDRVIPTNIGLLDARDRDKRFSMHVGSDVASALSEAEKAHKASTHIATSAFENGERVSVSAALSGRFWSPRAASNLAEWRRWCRRQGVKLTDDSLDTNSLFADMIIPLDVTERPSHSILAMEWPWHLYSGSGSSLEVTHQGARPINVLDTELRVDQFSTSGPLEFSLVAPQWELSYVADFSERGTHYQPTLQADASIGSSHKPAVPFSSWLNLNRPTLLLAGDQIITSDDRLLAPRTDLSPYPRERLRHMDWTASGVDIRIESQGPSRRADSIQAYMAAQMRRSGSFDVVIDDDRSGEAADLVGLSINGTTLHVTLVHCKYSSKPAPGARLQDLYEVCGQAMRGARWRDNGALRLLEHLDRRVQAYQNRTGTSPFEIGDRATLFLIRQRAPQLMPQFSTQIVQPGLSVTKSSDEQLRLIAGAATYIEGVTKGTFEVLCSD